MSKRNKSIYILKIAGLVLVAVIFVAACRHLSIERKATPNNYSDVNNIAETAETTATSQVAEPVPISPPEKLPAKKLLKIDFASQAPLGDWSQPYQDGCEEASIVMIDHFLKNQTLPKDQMKTEIDAAVAWQMATWAGHADLNAERTLNLAESYFKLSGKVIRSATTDVIKQQIVAGQPVIVPTAGRKLGNPNFTGAGPEYHMLVVKGYDDDQGVFITNDPGTRKGENYVYKYDVLIAAISGPREDMVKTVIIIWK